MDSRNAPKALALLMGIQSKGPQQSLSEVDFLSLLV